MKYFYKKDLIISLALAALALVLLLTSKENEGMIVVVLCALSAMVCGFVWTEKYDRYDREADAFGMGMGKRVFPFFIKGQERMNRYALNTYLWLLIPVLFGMVKVVSAFLEYS